MKKMFLLFGLLAMVGILFVACTDEQATAPPEPAEEAGEMDFSFTFPGCEAYFEAARPENKARALFRVFDGQIIAVSLVRQVRRNARYGRYDRAATKAWQLAALVNKKLPNRLVDPCGSGPPTTEAGAAMLMNEVFEMAHVDVPDGGLPPAAFLPEGGYGRVLPGVPDTIWTNNDEAAFVANSGSFSGDGPVTVVLTRLADPTPGNPGTPIPGYQAYPEAYDISADRELIGEAEFWMCVLDDGLPYPGKFDELVIGHDLGDGESELLPRLVEAFPGEVLDCGTAGFWSGPPAPPGGLVISALPTWLEVTGRLLEPVASRLLDVKSLNAMYFAGKGLGGRGGALSPFAPVDPGVTGPTLEVIVNGTDPEPGATYGHVVNGTVYDIETVLSTFSCTIGDGSCLIEDIPLGATVSMIALFEEGTGGIVEWAGICAGPADGDECQFTMTDGVLIAGVNFRVGASLNVTISATGGPGEATEVTDNHGNTCLVGDGSCLWWYEGETTAITITGTPDIASTSTEISGACTATVPAPPNSQFGPNSCSFVAFSDVTDYSAVVTFATSN